MIGIGFELFFGAFLCVVSSRLRSDFGIGRARKNYYNRHMHWMYRHRCPILGGICIVLARRWLFSAGILRLPFRFFRRSGGANRVSGPDAAGRSKDRNASGFRFSRDRPEHFGIAATDPGGISQQSRVSIDDRAAISVVARSLGALARPAVSGGCAPGHVRYDLQPAERRRCGISRGARSLSRQGGSRREFRFLASVATGRGFARHVPPNSC